MKTKKISLIFISFCAIVFVWASFLMFPININKASARELTSYEQIQLEKLLNYELYEYSDNLFQTKKYNDLITNLTSFSFEYIDFTNKVEENNLELTSEQQSILQEKYKNLENTLSKLENYLYVTYFEALNFKNKAMEFDYNVITLNNQQALESFKQQNIKFWNDEVFLTYLPNSYNNDENNKTSAESLANEAKKNIDNCLNKIIALNEYPSKLAYFESELEKLPNIVDVSESNKEVLLKLQKEINDFCTNYALHLDEQTKTKFENIKWRIDKSVARLTTNASNNFIIYLIVFVVLGVGIVMLVKYAIYPFIKNKFKGRKK